MIEFKNINLKFKDKIIFNNFNLQIPTGDKVIISAPSGRGKSTLLKIIMGFQKIESGEIIVDELTLSEKTVDEIREKIGYIPQMLYFKNKKVSMILDEIFSYKRNANKKLDEDLLTKLLHDFDLDRDILNKEFSNLSGGERQRLAFIITMLMDKEILLLDELTSSLDQNLKERVVKYLLGLNKTILMVTHDKVADMKGFKVIEL